MQPRVVVAVGLDLQPEGDAPLAAVLLGGELGADAVDLHEDTRVPGGVPQEAHGVEGALLDVRRPVAERRVYLQDPLVGVGPGPLGDLLRLDVLQAPLVEADPDGGAKPLLPVVGREVAQLLDLDLVALALVDVGEGGLAVLGGDAGGRRPDVLEPAVVLPGVLIFLLKPICAGVDKRLI